MSPKDDPSFLFELRIPGQYKGDPDIYIRAWDKPRSELPADYCRWGHSPIDVELRQGDKVIFPRGATYYGLPAGHTTDGEMSRANAMSTLAMKPGDTDEDYFATYTPEQLEWVSRNGEYLSMLATEREERTARRKAS